MVSLNRVFLMGNLVRDPELRQIPNGTSVCDMKLAVNRFFTAQDGERRQDTCFVDIVAWRRQAETCAEFLKKGAPVFVEGRLDMDQWQDNDGKRHSRLRVVANRVNFLPRGTRSDAPARESDAPARESDAPARGTETSAQDLETSAHDMEAGGNGEFSEPEPPF